MLISSTFIFIQSYCDVTSLLCFLCNILLEVTVSLFLVVNWKMFLQTGGLVNWLSDNELCKYSNSSNWKNFLCC